MAQRLNSITSNLRGRRDLSSFWTLPTQEVILNGSRPSRRFAMALAVLRCTSLEAVLLTESIDRLSLDFLQKRLRIADIRLGTRKTDGVSRK